MKQRLSLNILDECKYPQGLEMQPLSSYWLKKSREIIEVLKILYIVSYVDSLTCNASEIYKAKKFTNQRQTNQH